MWFKTGRVYIVSFYAIVDGHPCPLGPLDPLLYWYYILTSILNLNQVLLELIRQTDEQTELKFICTCMSRLSSLVEVKTLHIYTVPVGIDGAVNLLKIGINLYCGSYIYHGDSPT